MPITSSSRAETRSISVAAPPSTVVALLGDPQRLPEWAPGFAAGLRPDGSGGWLIATGGTPEPLEFRVAAGPGTVDLVRPHDRTAGAFIRAIPNRDGSEVVFTLLFPASVPEPAIAAQMTVVEDELATVRDLCRPRSGGAA